MTAEKPDRARTYITALCLLMGLPLTFAWAMGWLR